MALKRCQQTCPASKTILLVARVLCISDNDKTGLAYHCGSEQRYKHRTHFFLYSLFSVMKTILVFACSYFIQAFYIEWNDEDRGTEGAVCCSLGRGVGGRWTQIRRQQKGWAIQ
jgi:hypothetical protein